MLRVFLLVLVLAQGGAAPSPNPPPPSPPQQPAANSPNTKADPNTAKPGVQPAPTPQQPSAENRLASYTGWLTVFTFVLAAGTLGLFWVAARQGNQLEREFIATHRPKLVVRSVMLRNALIPGEAPRDFKMGFTLHYLVVNVGPTTATIVQATSTRSMVPNPREWTPGDQVYTSDGDGIVGRELKSGESCAGTCDNGSGLIESVAARSPFFPIYFLGYVVYEDSAGVQRRTGFIRRYDLKERSLVREPNPDYEYAD